MGSGFSYNEIPELCGTLPALELCYSMSQRFLDEHQPPSKAEELAPEPAAVVPPSSVQPIPNWKISSRGDIPDEVKARLSTGRRRCRATQFILRPGVFVHVLIADNGLTRSIIFCAPLLLICPSVYSSMAGGEQKTLLLRHNCLTSKFEMNLLLIFSWQPLTVAHCCICTTPAGRSRGVEEKRLAEVDGCMLIADVDSLHVKRNRVNFAAICVYSLRGSN